MSREEAHGSAGRAAEISVTGSGPRLTEFYLSLSRFPDGPEAGPEETVINLPHWSMRLEGAIEGDVFIPGDGAQPIDFARFARSVAALPERTARAAIDYEPGAARLDPAHPWLWPGFVGDAARAAAAAGVAAHLGAVNRLLTIAIETRPEIAWCLYGLWPYAVRGRAAAVRAACDGAIASMVGIDRCAAAGISLYAPALFTAAFADWGQRKIREIGAARDRGLPVLGWISPLRVGGGVHSAEDWRVLVRVAIEMGVDGLVFWADAGKARGSYAFYRPYEAAARELCGGD